MRGNPRPIGSVFALAAATLAVGSPSPARAQAASDLSSIQQQIQAGQQQQEQLKAQAAQLDREIADLQAAAVTAAGKVQDTESKVTELEDTLAALSDEEKTKTAALAAQRSKLTQAVMALQRLSSEPPEAMLLSAQSPIDAARAARLLAVITPALDGRARSLQSDLNELTEMRQQMAEQRDQLAAAVGQLASENARLSDLINKKAEAQRSTLAESASTQEKLDKLAKQAKNLQDLIDRLNKAKAETGPAAPPAPDLTETTQLASAAAPGGAERMQRPSGFRDFPDAAHIDSRNRVFAPARGRILTHFGEATDLGGSSKGLVIETRPGAQVVAPFDGRVAFEGPFRSYGQILIIEHGGGYHTVLAGLDRLDAVVGQWLLAGEPVGVMAQAGEPTAMRSGTIPLDSTGAAGRPRLYIELRRNGEPIDPVPWFGTAEANAVNSKGQ